MPHVNPVAISVDHNLIGREPLEYRKPRRVRKCECCGAALSIHNADKLCWHCDAAIQKWKLFPWQRAELEWKMEPHCKNYVREHFGKKKKVGKGIKSETSSGSFARAMGHKTIERK
jgi:hypothetical protein